MRFYIVKKVLPAALLLIAVLSNISYGGVIFGLFPRGDITGNLNFKINVDYTADTFGAGNMEIDDAYFSNNSIIDVTPSPAWTQHYWHHITEGHSANDHALQKIMHDVRLSNKASDAITVSLSDLIIENDYSLQLLLAENTRQRVFDIFLGPEILNNSAPDLYQSGINMTNQGTFIRDHSTASHSLLNLGLGKDALYAGNTPILNASLDKNGTPPLPESAYFHIIVLALFAIGAISIINEQTRHA